MSPATSPARAPRVAPAPPPASAGYRPFPDVGRRNLFQEALEVPAMVRLLGLPRGKRMLEVGCGRGIALPPLHRLCRPARLAALDIDRALLAEAERRAEARGVPAELFLGDVRRLPFEDGAFDVVIDFGTCYHIACPEAALREIARVLAPGGLFVHETRVSQLLSHPVRSAGRRLVWGAASRLLPHRSALLWASRVRV